MVVLSIVSLKQVAGSKKLVYVLLIGGGVCLLAVLAFFSWVGRVFDEAYRPFSYHSVIMDSRYDPPFDKPRIPKTARDIHVESSETLNEYDTRIRFTDSADAIETFLRETGVSLQSGPLPKIEGSFCNLDEGVLIRGTQY